MQQNVFLPDECLHIIINRTTFRNGGHNGAEIVIRKNHIGRLLGDLNTAGRA